MRNSPNSQCTKTKESESLVTMVFIILQRQALAQASQQLSDAGPVTQQSSSASLVGCGVVGWGCVRLSPHHGQV